MKDYISITKENADRILNLDKWETGVIIWILMTADESGKVFFCEKERD